MTFSISNTDLQPVDASVPDAEPEFPLIPIHVCILANAVLDNAISNGSSVEACIPTFKPEALPPEQLKTLEDFFGQELQTLKHLSQETSPELFCRQLFAMGERLQAQKPEAALLLFNYLAYSNDEKKNSMPVPPSIREQALKKFELASGKRSFGDELDLFVQTALKSGSDSALIGYALGTLAGKLVQGLFGRTLTRWRKLSHLIKPAGEIADYSISKDALLVSRAFTNRPVARFLSRSAGFAVEVPVATFSHHLYRHLLHGEDLFSHTFSDMASLAILLGVSRGSSQFLKTVEREMSFRIWRTPGVYPTLAYQWGGIGLAKIFQAGLGLQHKPEHLAGEMTGTLFQLFGAQGFARLMFDRKGSRLGHYIPANLGW